MSGYKDEHIEHTTVRNEKLQDILDKYIKKADEALAAKEKELMAI